VADVAKRASASKETVYRHFGNRTGLLIAGLKRFADITLKSCPAAQPDETFEQGLKRLGLWYLSMTKEPAVQSFYRYVVGSAEKDPELGKAFSEYMTDPIVEEFKRHMLMQFSSTTSRAVAETYMGMLQGKLWNRALVEPKLKITSEDIKKQVKLAIKLIINTTS